MGRAVWRPTRCGASPWRRGRGAAGGAGPPGRKRKRPAVGRATSVTFGGGAVGPTACARETGRFVLLVADSRVRPFRRQGSLGSFLYWPTAGSCSRVERSGSQAGLRARGVCKDCSLRRPDCALLVSDCGTMLGRRQWISGRAGGRAIVHHPKRIPPTSWPGPLRARATCGAAVSGPPAPPKRARGGGVPGRSRPGPWRRGRPPRGARRSRPRRWRRRTGRAARGRRATGAHRRACGSVP